MQTWSAKRIKEAIAKERLGTGSYSDVPNFKAAHGSQPQCGVPPGHGTCPVGGYAAGKRCASKPFVQPEEKGG